MDVGGHFTPRKRVPPSTHWVVGCVDPIAVLDLLPWSRLELQFLNHPGWSSYCTACTIMAASFPNCRVSNYQSFVYRQWVCFRTFTVSKPTVNYKLKIFSDILHSSQCSMLIISIETNILHIQSMHLDRLQNKCTNCKGVKNNTNFGQITGIQEKLDIACK